MAKTISKIGRRDRVTKIAFPWTTIRLEGRAGVTRTRAGEVAQRVLMHDILRYMNEPGTKGRLDRAYIKAMRQDARG